MCRFRMHDWAISCCRRSSSVLAADAQDLHATLPVEFHRVQGVYDRLHALSRLAHTLQNADKCLVHIFAHELLKFAEAHLGNFGKDLCPLVHGGNHLPVGGACRFGLLPQFVKGAGRGRGRTESRYLRSAPYRPPFLRSQRQNPRPPWRPCRFR